MGQVTSVLGMITGKIGNLRFSNWNGVNAVAQQPTSYTDANTAVQQGYRSDFKELAQLGRQAISAIRQGLSQFTNKTTPWATFMRLGKGAFQMSNGVLAWTDATLLRFAQGDLPGVIQTGSQLNPNGSIMVEWENNTAAFGALATDRVTLVVVNLTRRTAQVFSNVAARSAATVTINVGADYSGEEMLIYAFASELADPRHTSDSSPNL